MNSNKSSLNCRESCWFTHAFLFRNYPASCFLCFCKGWIWHVWVGTWIFAGLKNNRGSWVVLVKETQAYKLSQSVVCLKHKPTWKQGSGMFAYHFSQRPILIFASNSFGSTPGCKLMLFPSRSFKQCCWSHHSKGELAAYFLWTNMARFLINLTRHLWYSSVGIKNEIDRYAWLANYAHFW